MILTQPRNSVNTSVLGCKHAGWAIIKAQSPEAHRFIALFNDASDLHSVRLMGLRSLNRSIIRSASLRYE